MVPYKSVCTSPPRHIVDLIDSTLKQYRLLAQKITAKEKALAKLNSDTPRCVKLKVTF